MKILIITQAIDTENTTLGFFTRWVEEFSKRTEKVSVICLYKGKFNFPKNVDVYSLGKESGVSRFKYLKNFFLYIWKLRMEYDVVFVHMNQEYVVLGGLFWKLFGKKIFFWRNHPVGNILTKIAIKFSDQVFSTADRSFAMQYEKTTLMPSGIDTRFFRNDKNSREKNSILIFGRISPIKRIEIGIDLVALMLAKGKTVTLSIVGDFLERDREYFQSIKKRIDDLRLSQYIKLEKGVRFSDAVSLYQNHDIFLNFTESGSFDKTVIEALACGCKVLVSNTSMKDILPLGSWTQTDPEKSIVSLEKLLSLYGDDLSKYMTESREVVKEHSLDNLVNKIFICINKKL